MHPGAFLLIKLTKKCATKCTKQKKLKSNNGGANLEGRTHPVSVSWPRSFPEGLSCNLAARAGRERWWPAIGASTCILRCVLVHQGQTQRDEEGRYPTDCDIGNAS